MRIITNATPVENKRDNSARRTTPQPGFTLHVVQQNSITFVSSSGYCSLFTQESSSRPALTMHSPAHKCVRMLKGWGGGLYCTLCWDEERNVHVCVCLLFCPVHACLCKFVGHSRLMLPDTCGSLISTRSRDSQQKPSYAGIHGNHKNYISSFPRQAGDSEMLKCTNTLSLPGCLILNRAGLFLPAVLIVQCCLHM